MEIKIDIPDKLYEELKEMCDYNSLTIENYVTQTIMDNYYTIKFGDLNEKIKNVREKKEQPKVEEKKKEEIVWYDKEGKVNEVKQTEVEKPKEEKKDTETETVKEKNEPVIEDASKVTEKKVKRTRTLKTTK
jgi:hypothetical protein